MKKITKTVMILALVLLLPAVFARPTAFTQTIPAINANGSRNVIQGCLPTIAFPGNVVTGDSGTIVVTCPNSFGVVNIVSNSTPTFLLATGYTKIAIVYHSPNAPPVTSCNFHFSRFLGGGITGMNLTSNVEVTVTPTQVQGQLLAGQYDYCLEYRNVSALGLTGFGISWA